MRVVITGSREWADVNAIRARLAQLPPGTLVVVGGAKGADTLADHAAHTLGLPVEHHQADWELHGKAAGIIRNLEMLDTRPDLVLAFWDGESRGTKHCMDAARERGIPVEVVQ